MGKRLFSLPPLLPASFLLQVPSFYGAVTHGSTPVKVPLSGSWTTANKEVGGERTLVYISYIEHHNAPNSEQAIGSSSSSSSCSTSQARALRYRILVVPECECGRCLPCRFKRSDVGEAATGCASMADVPTDLEHYPSYCLAEQIYQS